MSQSDVAGIPPIALSIPDFEGQAVLRLFSNDTQSEVACYSAVVTNGASFSHPAAVGTVLGLFTLVAVIASFATTVYGDHMPTMRTHYAHSLSILVIFAVFQHIYFTGALSVHWPSVLVAWWHNFAWSGGMIYSESMQNSINQLIGSNRGNISFVGAVSAGPDGDQVGGGYSLEKVYAGAAGILARSVPAGPSPASIYKRWTSSVADVDTLLRQRSYEGFIAKRAEAQSSNTVDSPWYGEAAKPGLPVPGNFSGLAGTLSEEDIPASNAFMTGFFWLLILLTIVATSVIAFKWALEGLSKTRWIKSERLNFFRANWIRYTRQALLRTLYISFFMMMYLAMFQFAFAGKGGAAAIAALTFIALLLGMGYLVGRACYERIRLGHWMIISDRLHVERGSAFGFLPFSGFGLQSSRTDKPNPRPSLGSFPLRTIRWVANEPDLPDVNQDEEFIFRQGWLTARFRRTRWWFFAAWLFYEFLRACFYGGAAGHPMTQVFGLLVIEILAFLFLLKTRPFEGFRLNALVVYVLSISKVLSVALSAAFASQFRLQRIQTTIVGVIIIVIQGILTIVLLIAIIIGAVSSYMSLTRNHEDFKPRKWAKIRERYFTHLEKAAHDLPPPPPPAPEEPKEPYFDVKAVRRESKIEDEGVDMHQDPRASRTSVTVPRNNYPTSRASRATSMGTFDSSQANLPYGARPHRASWSLRDVESYGGVDSVRSSRHMSAAIGLHSSPHSRHASTYTLGHHPSKGSLQPRSQEFTSPTPATDSGALDMRRSRPPTASASLKDRDPAPNQRLQY